jgi:hypothetical protein
MPGGELAAQAVAPGAMSDSTLTRLIAKQERIRIQVGTGKPVELLHPRIEGGLLVGQAGSSGRAEYFIQELNQVWRRGRSPDIGFAIGAGIGFVGGAAAVSSLGSSLCTFSCKGSSGSEILKGGILGGMTVGAFGALIGLVAVERWRSVFKVRGLKATPIVTGQRVGVSFSF